MTIRKEGNNMGDETNQSSFWSRPTTRWVITAILGIVFLLALVVFLVANLVNDILLDPELYNSALEETGVYERIYTELLADPALKEATALFLGNLNLDPGLADNILTFTTSTLYLVLPPDTIQTAVEGAIYGMTAYLRGDAEELQPRLDLTAIADENLVADRIIDGVLAFLAELLAKESPDLPDRVRQLDQTELSAYLTNIGQGSIGSLPDSTSASVADLSTVELQTLVGVLLGSAAETASPNTRFQIEFALLADDLPGALALATSELLETRVEEAAVVLVNDLKNSEALNTLTTAARTVEQTEEELINRINAIRRVVIFLDSVLKPLMLLVMVLTLGTIVWIHADNLIEMLRTISVTLLATGAVVALAWLLLSFWLRQSLESQLATSSELPITLENMILDVVAAVSSSVWQEVLASVTVPIVLGLALLILSFLPRLTKTIDRLLKPVRRQRKIVIVGGVLAIVLVPVLLLALIRERQQPEMACNGYVELCDRPINDVVFAATHNAMSIAEYGWIWPSHDGNITNQLNAGVRAFLIDSHYWDDQAWIESHLHYLPPDLQVAWHDIVEKIELNQEDGTYLCHMMCSLGATNLAETFEEFRLFLETHPDDVVVLIIEDIVTPADTQKAFQDSGLEELVYTYEPGAPWPTLRQMIEENKRVLVLAEEERPPPDWYLNAWDYTEETPYLFSEVADFEDDTYSCQPNRGEVDKPFFLLNHWVTRISPSRVDAAIINDHEYLMDRVQQCAEERGQLPNFVAVNFYLNGDVFDVVDELNGVSNLVDQ
jgi:hypothetical protein